MEEIEKGEIVIYKDEHGPGITVRFEGESVWLNQAELASLFGKDVRTISEHINNIYKEKELERAKTTLKQANSGNSGTNRQTTYYNLDVAISVGYRVKSKRGTQFRIWATKRIRDYIIKGFAINEARLKDYQKLEVKLKELEGAHKLIQNVLESKKLAGYEKELLNIITDYANTWFVLNAYDQETLKIEEVKKYSADSLEYSRVKKIIEQFQGRLIKNKQATSSFGEEQGEKLEAILNDKTTKSFEEQAAQLLYRVIKDKPFVDGNKRIGSLLFLLCLIENRYLYNKKGERKINDTALAALALLISESKPAQKEAMIKLIVNLINKQ